MANAFPGCTIVNRRGPFYLVVLPNRTCFMRKSLEKAEAQVRRFGGEVYRLGPRNLVTLGDGKLGFSIRKPWATDLK